MSSNLHETAIKRQKAVKSLFWAIYLVASTALPRGPIALAAAPASPDDTARQILATSGVHGGLVVHLGCGDGTLTAALAKDPSYVVQGMDSDPENVRRARQYIRSLGLYGRVSIDRDAGPRLPYADNLVNLLVLAGEVDKPPGTMYPWSAEVLRVLAPGGVACFQKDGTWQKTVKPRPKDIDEWTHYLHDASGNAVAADLEVGTPRYVRWLAAPVWSRSHEYNPSLNAAVSAGGRIFYTLDEGLAGIHDSPKFRFPDRWSLVARDAFSGVLLWKRPIPRWGDREWNSVSNWCAPLTLARRLVADGALGIPGSRVFFTLGYKAPVTVLDAATGETLRTIPESQGTDEMILADGVLFLCVREQLSVAKPHPTNNPRAWKLGGPGPARLMAVDVESGKVLWSRPPQPVMILTLAASAKDLCFHDSDERGAIVCLDRKTGRQRWTAPCVSTHSTRGSGGTLVMRGDVILFTGAKGLTAFSAADGRQLWIGPKIVGPSGNHPPDLFVADGLVWGGDPPGVDRNKQPAVKREGRDLETGEIKRTIEVPKLFSSEHHVRCYRSKATDRFLLLPNRGVEFFDIQGSEHERNDWVRAACSYGFLPCNGLLYMPPHPCFCYPGVKLNGFWALASRQSEAPAESGARLERGTAYDENSKSQISNAKSQISNLKQIQNPKFKIQNGNLAASPRLPISASPHPPLSPSPDRTPSPDDWPTYRHDAARSGHLAGEVPARLAPSWRTPLGGRLSQPVVVGGTLYVAQVDSHTVHALDAASGRALWSYTAGGRVDSPPTIHAGLVLFGCRDGWVYCLRAADGALVWRFRAAPASQRIVAFEQLESPWPVPGSVLVQNGVAYLAAGRSSHLDGGVYLYGLDPASGRVLHQVRVNSPPPDPFKEVGRGFDMEGTKSDILVGDGKDLYMYKMVFDAALHVEETPRPTTVFADRPVGLHLMSTGGLLDYEWYDRTFWIYSRRWPGYYYADEAPHAGQILVFDERAVYGLHVFTSRLFLSPAYAPGSGCTLFADDAATELVKPKPTGERQSFLRSAKPKWSHVVPVRARGMVLAGKTLFLAGPPDLVPDDDPYASFEGRLGGKLWAVATSDGARLAEYDLKAPPVFDGLIAAAGRLYLSTADGAVECFGRK